MTRAKVGSVVLFLVGMSLLIDPHLALPLILGSFAAMDSL